MKALFAAVLVCCLSIAVAGQSDVRALAQAQLEKDYVGHVVALRMPGLQADLKFDESGAPIAPITPAPLANGGMVFIDGLRVAGNRLEVEARRVLLVGAKLRPLLTGERTRIEVDFRTPLLNVGQVSEVMQRILLTPAEYQQATANYYVATNPKAKPGERVGTLSSNCAVYLVGNSMKLPRRTRSAKPVVYSDQTGNVDLWVVIDESGIPAYFGVDYSPSQDLEDSAVAAVARWRFTAPMNDGRPVCMATAVRMTFE